MGDNEPVDDFSTSCKVPATRDFLNCPIFLLSATPAFLNCPISFSHSQSIEETPTKSPCNLPTISPYSCFKTRWTRSRENRRKSSKKGTVFIPPLYPFFFRANILQRIQRETGNGKSRDKAKTLKQKLSVLKDAYKVRGRNICMRLFLVYNFSPPSQEIVYCKGSAPGSTGERTGA